MLVRTTSMAYTLCSRSMWWRRNGKRKRAERERNGQEEKEEAA